MLTSRSNGGEPRHVPPVEERRGPRSAARSPAIIRSVVVLPEPGRPEHREELAVANVEVDAGDRGDVAEALLDSARGGPPGRRRGRVADGPVAVPAVTPGSVSARQTCLSLSGPADGYARPREVTVVDGGRLRSALRPAVRERMRAHAALLATRVKARGDAPDRRGQPSVESPACPSRRAPRSARSPRRRLLASPRARQGAVPATPPIMPGPARPRARSNRSPATISFPPPTVDLVPGETVLLHVVNGGLEIHEAIIGDERDPGCLGGRGGARSRSTRRGPTPDRQRATRAWPACASWSVPAAASTSLDGPGGRSPPPVARRVPHPGSLGEGDAVVPVRVADGARTDRRRLREADPASPKAVRWYARGPARDGSRPASLEENADDLRDRRAVHRRA